MRHASDVYYLQTCDALAAAKIDAGEFAHRTGLLLLKPDAAITGSMRPALSWLLAHGYRIVGAYPVNLTGLHLRALWYFNWHRATPERRRLADRLAGMSASLVVLVTHPEESLAVSARLTADKGPADPAQRVPGQLRSDLSAGTYLLNLVHSADDPDDLLRELGIYFTEAQLGEVISNCAAGGGIRDAQAEAFRIADDIESSVPRRSGDLAAVQDAVWDRLLKSLVTQRPATPEQWLACLDGLDSWSRTVIESAYLPMHCGR